MTTAAEAPPASVTALDAVGQISMAPTHLCSSYEQAYYATVIQKNWRGYQMRRSMLQQQINPKECSVSATAERPQLQDQPRLMELQQAPESHPYQNDVWVPAAGTVVRNRGALKAAVRLRAQQNSQQQQSLRKWEAFAERQAKRYVPLQSHSARSMLADSICYCLRIQHISNLPPLMSSVKYGSTFELQLRVTLFDQLTGMFFGNTCHSSSIQLAQPQQASTEAVVSAADAGPGLDVDFCFDVYFHTAVSDPRCMAVVEVVIVENDPAGAAVGRFSIGWAQLPLFTQPGIGGKLCKSQAAAAPIMAGTPRYLLFRSLCNAETTLPTVMQGSQLTYQVEVYPAMNPVRPLLPPDCLVSYTDTIPGLQRHDRNGQPTTSCKSSISTLRSPVLAPASAVSLHGVQLKLPQVLHNLISVLPQLAGVTPPPDLPLLLAVPIQPAAVSYTLLAGVHNGRTFIGPQLVIEQLEVQPIPGSVVLKPAVGLQEMQLSGIMQDELVVIELELLAEPAADEENVHPFGPVLLGRTVTAPYVSISADGASAILSEGLHRLRLSCCSDGGSSCPLSLHGGETQGMLPLNWRAMLGDTAVRAAPEPVIELELAASQIQPVAASSGQRPSKLAQPRTLQRTSRSQTALQQIPQHKPEPVDVKCRKAAAAKSLPASGALPASVDRLPGDTRASMSLRMAALELKEAASIPMQDPMSDQLQIGVPAYQVPGAGQSADNGLQGHQQLQQLADTMQQQITALARAVEELKEERHTLRSSLTVVQSAVPENRQEMPGSEAGVSTMLATAQSPRSPNAEGPASPHALTSTIPAAELEQLKAMRPTVQGQQPEVLAGFSGAQAAAVQGMVVGCCPHTPSTPTRMVMQQLHEAGMTRGLPVDVQAVLSRSTGTASGSSCARRWLTDLKDQFSGSTQSIPLMMDVEARDPRTASDVVIQLLAFRPTSEPEAAAQLPAALSSMYFTMQFYDSGPIVTDPCWLVPGDGRTEVAATAGGNNLDQQSAAAATQHQDGIQHTYVLMAAQQAQSKGAGLILKFHIDGSSPEQLSPLQDPGQAAFDSNLAFCRYLATHQLAIDVWDGDSLLQLGTATTSLQGLLRQGQEYSEVLVEVPVSEFRSSNCISSADGLAVTRQQSALETRMPLQLGQLVIRLINIGREPSNAAARAPDCNAVDTVLPTRTAGKKVRLRAAPLEPSSPVARELSMQGSNSPFKVDWHQQQQQQHAGDNAHPTWSSAGATAASDILSFEHRKVARARQLKELLNSSPGQSSPGSPVHNISSPHTPSNSPARGVASAYCSSAGGESDDPIRAVQRQLLADVDAVRKRQKAGFLRSQLRKDLVTTCTVQPCLGQTLLLEHVLHNPLGRDAVFELRISHPEELKAVESMQVYRQLQVAAAPVIMTSSTAAAAVAGGSALQAPSLASLVRGDGMIDVGEQLVTRNRIFLRANERIGIPLSLRLAVHHDARVRQEEQRQRVIAVEFVPLELDYPTNILELQVNPKPLVVDRTLRYHSPEKCMLRASVPLTRMAGAASLASTMVAATAGGGILTAAASRPDVAVGVSSACSSSGSSGCPELTIRFKCGLSPEVVQFYVWVYADACMARPLEVWQVSVHALQMVNMRAVVGQVCSTSLAVAGGTAGDRQVVCCSSSPAELKVTPAVMSLPAGAISALHLSFKPYRLGQDLIRVHIVARSSRELVHAFLVATEAMMPQISKRIEIACSAGSVTQQQVLYANPYSQQSQGFRCFKFVTNMPWVLSFQPAWLELAPRASKPVSVVVGGRRLKAGAVVQALWFVRDELDREEECMEVIVVVQ